MSFLSDFSTGLGAIGGLVPGYGTALATAGAIAGRLGGAPDALALNPYPDTGSLFDPQGMLWGAPLLPTEYGEGGTQAALPFAYEQADASAAAGAWLARVRKSWKATGSVGIAIAAGGVWMRTTTTAAKSPQAGQILKVAVINAYLDSLEQRHNAMRANAEPVFHYIDTRTWEQAEKEWWMRTAPLGTGVAELDSGSDSSTPKSPQALATWRKSATGMQAKAAFLAQRDINLQAFAAEKQRWLDWKAQLDNQQAQQQQTSTLTQEFQDYLQTVEPGTPSDEVLAGFARSQADTAQTTGVPAGTSALVGGSAAMPADTPTTSGDGIWLVLLGLGALFVFAEVA